MHLILTAAEHTNRTRRSRRFLLAVGLLLLAAPTAAAAQRVTVVQTTANLHDALTVQAPQAFVAKPAAGSTVIRVDASVTYQQIIGFGGAMTDTSAWLLYDELAPAARDATLLALFGPGGIGLNFVRIPIGASDFTVSLSPYTYDDEPFGQTDQALVDFSIAHDETYIIPALRQVLSVNPGVFTLASPWTPPPWMKANHTFDNFGLNYFQYGQTTKYVHPGAVRIFSTRHVSDGDGTTRGVDNVAFVNPDGSKVLVAYNNRVRAARLAVRWRGRYLNWRLPGRGAVTFIWR
jgi:O-glycosyl hydrolase